MKGVGWGGGGREGLGEGGLGGIKSGRWYTGGQTKDGSDSSENSPAGEREIERA